MNIFDIFDRDLFIRMREEGYIRVQTLDASTLAIANYTEKAQYEREWNPVTLNCRGLIFDIFSHDVRARPFPKFFNWDDGSQPYPPRGTCLLMPKMDGSLGILYWYDGLPWIATRGSFTSDQAKHATLRLRQLAAEYNIDLAAFSQDHTYLFEIIYPENRIVVNYGDRDDLVLLDVINNVDGRSNDIEFQVADWPDKVSKKAVKFDDSLIHEIPEGEEGFVLYWPYQDFRVKMKSAEYISLHKMIFGLNARGVWERLGEGETWQDICDGLPDEFHAWVRDIADGLKYKQAMIHADALTAHKRIRTKLAPGYERKEFAKLAVREPNSSYLFMLEDGKDPASTIWKSLKPSGADGIKVISEDVA